ncbi:cupin domain-containing protein [Deinococcus apachensis]|uniref:cupin domain-containing protein n=1 Tax=Deinococcus apachensis TaxID=309886 RepID=UPI0012F8F8D6|nr:cupin domain-containing protein [Deinococcus apachensis]
MKTNPITVRRLTGALAAGALLGLVASGQTPGVTLRAAHAAVVTGQPSEINVEQDVLEIAPGACTGYHEHGGPGLETVISGTVTVETRGAPGTKAFTAGQMYVYAAGTIHNFCNRGKVPAVFTAAFLLPKGVAPVTPR